MLCAQTWPSPDSVEFAGVGSNTHEFASPPRVFPGDSSFRACRNATKTMGAGASLNIPEHLANDPMIQDTYKRIKNLFNAYDSRKFENLTRDDFFALCNDFPGHFTNPKSVEEAFTYLDKNHDSNISLKEFNRLWEGFQSPPQLHSLEEKMEQFRIAISAKHKIAYGLSFYEFQSAGTLDPRCYKTWTALEVYLWLVTCPELHVIREDLDRVHWADVDGVCLLELTAEDFQQKGIRAYHVKKITAVIDTELRRQGQKRVSPVQPISTSTVGLDAGITKSGSVVSASTPRTPARQLSKSQDGKMSFQWKRGDLLGQGAYGKVFQGLDTNTGVMMAVKEMTFTKDSVKEVEELKNEISLLRKLKHENIVMYFGAEIPEESDGCVIHIFTELMPQGSLMTVMKKFGKFSEAMTREYTKQMVAGLVYLHENNIIHRDIKPANVLVNEHGVVKLADFGASKKMSGTETVAIENTTLKGTPYFMAPEVLTQKGHGRKADVWSLGATVLQLISGDPPWKSMQFDSVVQLMCHVAQNENAGPELPPTDTMSDNLYSFLQVCFERDVEKRPSSLLLSKHSFLSDGLATNADEPTILDPMNNTMTQIDASLTRISSSQGPAGQSEGLYDSVDLDGSFFGTVEQPPKQVSQGGGGGAPPQITTDASASVEVMGANPFARGGAFSPGTPGKVIAAQSPRTDQIVEDGDASSVKKKKKKQKKKPGYMLMDETMCSDDEEEGVAAGNATSETAPNQWAAREERPISSTYHKQNLETLHIDEAKKAADEARNAEFARMREVEMQKFSNSQTM